MTTAIVILLVVLVLGGAAFYLRSRWTEGDRRGGVSAFDRLIGSLRAGRSSGGGKTPSFSTGGGYGDLEGSTPEAQNAAIDAAMRGQ